MQPADLLVQLAGIAGVFVGFGALIAVRGGGVSDAREVAYMRAVVWMGLMTVVAALAPLTLGLYDLSEQHVWRVSSVIVLAGYFGMVAISVRTPEAKASEAAASRAFRVTEGMFSLLWAVVAAIALIVIALGLRPELDAALYVTVVVLILLGAGGTLLELVFAQRRPATA